MLVVELARHRLKLQNEFLLEELQDDDEALAVLQFVLDDAVAEIPACEGGEHLLLQDRLAGQLFHTE